MAYRDPYTERYGQRYTDEPVFDPYNDNAHAHQPYDQGGYDPYTAGAHPTDTNPFPSGHYKSESTQYNQAAFAQATGGSRPRNLKRWRREHHSGLWAKGSRVACIGRFCCCTLMIIVFLIVSVLLPLALWTRPPNVVVGSVQLASNGSDFQTITNGFEINLQLPIYVSNPNYFSVSFSSIKADIYYPTYNTLIGQGEEDDVTFDAHSSTNITFPFSIEYTTTMSSGAEIIADVLSKCESNTDITVDYDITLALRILFFTVSPTISNSASFACPSEVSSAISSLSGI